MKRVVWFKNFRLLAIGLVFAGLLVGCGQTNNNGGTVTPGATATTGALVTATSGPTATSLSNTPIAAAGTPTSSAAATTVVPAGTAGALLTVPLQQAFLEASLKLNPAKELGEAGITKTQASLTGLKVTQDADKGFTITGMLEGAKFLLRIPDGWNGELMLYAHGYTQPGGSLEVPQLNTHTRALVNTAFTEKFAYGYSAYAKTGYAVRSGIESTQLLKRLAELAMPVKRSYITGDSLGGDVVMGLIEKYPDAYTGALSSCGVVAGWYEETRYITDFRLIYDYFTRPLGAPYAIGNPPDPQKPNDPGFNLGSINISVATLFQKAVNDPAIAAIVQQISKVSGVHADFNSFFIPLLSSLADAGDEAATAGGNGYSNLDKVYQGSNDDKALNTGIIRIKADPDATKYLNDWYTSTGSFKTKLISMHNLIDPLVPYEFEGLLKKQVEAKNNTQNLVQWTVDPQPPEASNPLGGGPSHCYFNSAQMKFAWEQLRNWVEQGARPEDNINITNK